MLNHVKTNNMWIYSNFDNLLKILVLLVRFRPEPLSFKSLYIDTSGDFLCLKTNKKQCIPGRFYDCKLLQLSEDNLETHISFYYNFLLQKIEGVLNEYRFMSSEFNFTEG